MVNILMVLYVLEVKGFLAMNKSLPEKTKNLGILIFIYFARKKSCHSFYPETIQVKK